MNKKYFLGMFAAAGMLLATSCSNDELIEQGSGDMATVSFNITTEGAPMSRAISDGTKAGKLVYRVYDKDGNIINGQDNNYDYAFTSGKTVNVRLAKGQTYQVAFWAQDADCKAYGTDDLRAVTVDYTTVNTNNDENRDAFFATKEIVVNGDQTEPVTLTRPFAQVNVGVTEADWEAAVKSGVTVTASEVVIKNAANKIDLVTGNVEGSEEVSYVSYDIPTEQLKNVAGNDYHYLSMCYVLPNATPADQSTTVAAEFKFNSTKEPIELKKGLEHLTIQRNWRTNIVGTLLTGNVDFEVVINPIYTGDHNYNNGEYSSVPQLVDGNYEVYNAKQWNWLAYNKQEGASIKLAADIDFNNESVVNMYYGVSIDGNGHALKNLKIVAPAGHPSLGDNWAVGLFKDVTSDITVKDLTIDGIEVENYNDEGNGFAAALFGAIESNTTVTVDGLTLKNADIKGVQSVGGIAGYIASGGKLIVKNTTLENNYIHNYDIDGESGFVAGLAGKVVGTLEIGESVKLNNNNIIGIWANKLSRGERSIQEIAATYTEISGTITGSPMTNGNSVQKYECGTKLVSTAEDLVNIANDVNNNGYSYNGKTVVLLSDIDLAGINWTPIGQTGSEAKAQFLGTFDGNGKTISGLKVTSNNSSTTNGYGLFGWLQGTVKNLTVSGANITASHNVGVIAGYVEFGTVSNCTVSDATITASHVNNDLCGDKVGGVAGYLANQNGSKIENCKVTNTTITAGRDAGQVVGCAYSAAGVTGCEAINVTLTAGTGCTGANMGGIIGRNLNP